MGEIKQYYHTLSGARIEENWRIDPCPCCGAGPELLQLQNVQAVEISTVDQSSMELWEPVPKLCHSNVVCLKCRFRGPEKPSAIEAITAWNEQVTKVSA